MKEKYRSVYVPVEKKIPSKGMYKKYHHFVDGELTARAVQIQLNELDKDGYELIEQMPITEMKYIGAACTYQCGVLLTFRLREEMDF